VGKNVRCTLINDTTAVFGAQDILKIHYFG